MTKETQQALEPETIAGDEDAFRALLEPLSRELHVYAYRMLGGFQDAEDALANARLKAWQNIESYPPRTNFRAWMYRIVTTTCLDMLRTRHRRVLPQDIAAPVAPGPPLTEMSSDISWVEPYPDALLPGSTDPEATLQLHHSVRLALIRALQVLPARQRAALILHDVLAWSAAEVATMLETTDTAITSALPRSRATLASAGGAAAPSPPDLQAARAEAVTRLVNAWHSGDFDDLAALLADGAILSMPPWIYWLEGREAVKATLLSPGTWQGEPRPGRYHLVPVAMNGQPAALSYLRGDDGAYQANSLTVLTLDPAGRISELTVFVLPALLATWGHPATLPAPPAV